MSLFDVVGTSGIVVEFVAVALEIVMLARAARAHARTRDVARALAAGAWSTSAAPSPLPNAFVIGPAIPLLLVLGRMIYAVQRSRAIMLGGVTGADPVPKVSLASLGLEQELGAVLSGMLGLVLPLILGAMAAAFAISARSRRAGLAHAIELASRDREAAVAWASCPGFGVASVAGIILGLVVLGLGPVIAAGISGASLQLQAFDEVTRTDPAAKAALYGHAQHVAGMLLERGYHAAIVGVVCAAVGSAIFLWLRSPSRARAQLLGRPAPDPLAWRGGAVTGAVLATAAIAVFALARPLKRENETPWPSGSANDRLGVETPTLDGPDRLEVGPLVAVTTLGFAFDRDDRDAAGVEAGLRAYRANFPLLHPGEPPPREILFACAPNAGTERVLAAIEVARRSGYDGVRFVFESARTVVRPVIGTVTLRNVTAARATISLDGATPRAETEFVRLEDSPTCAQLAARVVALRRTGRPVLLLLSAARAERHQPLQE